MGASKYGCPATGRGNHRGWSRGAVAPLRPGCARPTPRILAVIDVAIIGAGHNGLVCAAYLARAGLSVECYERRDLVGGACVTEELWPGVRASPGAYTLSLLRREIVRDLSLDLSV